MSPLHTQQAIARPLILCVEDGPNYLALRKAVLQQAGYNVIGVTTAADALKTLREAPVCATIADHMLQGITGAELGKQMKKIKPEVPIILFSGTFPEHLEGVDVYINKSEPTAEFLRIVGDVVERACSYGSLSQSGTLAKPVMSYGRRGTRVSCEIPLILTNLDAVPPFPERGVVILVNPQGCAVRSPHPIGVGASVRLEGLPSQRTVTARVVNCISLGEHERFWLLGLALDQPGNLWGIEAPPADWAEA